MTYIPEQRLCAGILVDGHSFDSVQGLDALNHEQESVQKLGEIVCNKCTYMRVLQSLEW